MLNEPFMRKNSGLRRRAILRALTLAARPAALSTASRRARAGRPPRATIQPNEPGHAVRHTTGHAGRRGVPSDRPGGTYPLVGGCACA
eukprot:5696737-Prymnesium_polylepis.1